MVRKEIVVKKSVGCLKSLFGILKGLNKSSQELKDKMRKSWDHA